MFSTGTSRFFYGHSCRKMGKRRDCIHLFQSLLGDRMEMEPGSSQWHPRVRHWNNTDFVGSPHQSSVSIPQLGSSQNWPRSCPWSAANVRHLAWGWKCFPINISPQQFPSDPYLEPLQLHQAIHSQILKAVTGEIITLSFSSSTYKTFIQKRNSKMSVCTPQTPFSVYFPPQLSSFHAARSELYNTFSFTIFSEQNSIPKFCTASPMAFPTQNSSGSGWKCIIKEFWPKILNNFCCIKGSFCGSTQRFSGRAAGHVAAVIQET